MVKFADEHDFHKYPELTNSELEVIGLTSPHVQIERDFKAVVVKVIDGDTVKLRTDFRDFDFNLRFLEIDAPELSTGAPGEEAKEYLTELVFDKEVEVKVNRFNRVDKFGRLLGSIVTDGIVVNEAMIHMGHAQPFDNRREGEITHINIILDEKQWF